MLDLTPKIALGKLGAFAVIIIDISLNDCAPMPCEAMTYRSMTVMQNPGLPSHYSAFLSVLQKLNSLTP